ncbi:MAG: LPS assembly lipoprotein LptE [Tannerellaceae bacterium]|nr:LPS assembly lipoprotein LptE [Tannerellaceae bacterium]
MKGRRLRTYAYLLCLPALCCTGCKISYSFSGASVDYTVTKTISISDFPNQAPLVYPPLSQSFTEELKDNYIRRTKLQMIQNNGDLDIEGEITGYDMAPMAIREDNYSSMTKLTMSVRVRFANRANQDKDFEQSFSAYREFDSNRMLQDIQDELNGELVKEIVDQIYNATVADW